MIIREATSEDLEALLALNRAEYPGVDWDSLNRFERWEIGMWWVDPELLQWHFDILRRCNGGILVIESNSHITAELDFCESWEELPNYSGNRYHIIWLTTHPLHRRQGLSSQLVSELHRRTNHPIWVEAEDSRTVGLYGKIGKENHFLSNWRVEINDITEYYLDNRLEYTVISYEDLDQKKSDYFALIGRYYAPAFDLSQLRYSDPIKELMWADTPSNILHHYRKNETEVIALMTQFPRIFVSKSYMREDLEAILASVCLQLFEMGFDSLEFQVYYHVDLISILSNLGFSEVIQKDPVYELFTT